MFYVKNYMLLSVRIYITEETSLVQIVYFEEENG